MPFGEKQPPILQNEAAECGVACLAMIATHHGHRVTLAELRRRFAVSMKGTTLKSVMSMADAMGMVSRPVRVELGGVPRLRLPCIIHWDLRHFVVLTRVRGQKYTINDPGRGRITIDREEFSTHFTGVALELTPAPSFEKRETVERVKLGDLWSRMTGFLPNMAQLILLSLMLQVINLSSPLVSQFIIDDAIGKGDADTLTIIVVGAFILALLQASIRLSRAFIAMQFGVMLNFQMRGNLLRHMLRLPVAWFEKRKLGDVMSRFNSLGPVQGFITGSAMSAFLDGTMAVITFVAMLMYSPVLTAAAMLSITVLTLVRLATFSHLRNMTAQGIQLNARVDSIFVETIRGSRAFKIFGREQERHATWQNAYAEAVNNNLRIAKFTTVRGEAGMSLLSAAIGLLVFYLGARSVIAGTMTIGMFVAFQAYKAQWDGAAQSLVGLFFSYKFLGLHLDRLADVIHTDMELTDEENLPSSALRPLRGKIELRGVSFRYADHEDWVLRDASLIVEPGDHVAFVGASGGGKSTLLKLLIGIYPPTEGKILIDDMPMTAFGISAYREKIGVVMQDDQLFAGTISDNISFFDADPDLDWIEECAKMAAVHDEIIKMPMGYMTLIGDLGSTLSGGQRQRVMLARALYRRPSVLFLDEGTANLDPLTETSVTRMLATLGITRIVVAHRPAAIEGADKIFEVGAGLVISTLPADSQPSHFP